MIPFLTILAVEGVFSHRDRFVSFSVGVITNVESHNLLDRDIVHWLQHKRTASNMHTFIFPPLMGGNKGRVILCVGDPAKWDVFGSLLVITPTENLECNQFIEPSSIYINTIH